MNRTPIHEQLLLPRFHALLRERPESVLFTEIDDEGQDGASLSVRELHDRASSIAKHLLKKERMRPGDRAMLLFPQSVEVIAAFMGCVYAGVIPVPAAPPHPLQPADDLRVFATIAANAGAQVVLTEGSYQAARRLGQLKGVFTRGPDWPQLRWVRVDKIKTRPAPPAVRSIEADELAYLQYTSGSTSDPKGVRVRYGNLAHQMQLGQARSNLRPSAVGVLWVPYFHDLCLVSGIIAGLYGLGRLYLMSPLTFLRRPHLWMQVVSRVRGTHTAAPDFALRLAARKTSAAQLEGLDLSSLELIGVGAEMNRIETHDRFMEVFTPVGLDPRAYTPAYGLAEHTLFVCQTHGAQPLHVDREAIELERRVEPVAGGEDCRTVLAHGVPDHGVEVAIVDLDTATSVEDGHVGEIWLSSRSITGGYWERPDLDEAFAQRLPGSSDPWLRTGDLGFLYEEQLYIAGRCKDLIIVNGRNLYPEDLEACAHDCPELKPGRTVAYAVEHEGEERVAIAAELRDGKLGADARAQCRDRLLTALREHHRVSSADVLLLPPDALPRTTSGKLRRQAARQRHEHNLASCL